MQLPGLLIGLREHLLCGSHGISRRGEAGAERDVGDDVSDLLAAGTDRERRPDVSVDLWLSRGVERGHGAGGRRLAVLSVSGPHLRPLNLAAGPLEASDVVA